MVHSIVITFHFQSFHFYKVHLLVLTSDTDPCKLQWLRDQALGVSAHDRHPDSLNFSKALMKAVVLPSSEMENIIRNLGNVSYSTGLVNCRLAFRLLRQNKNLAEIEALMSMRYVLICMLWLGGFATKI